MRSVVFAAEAARRIGDVPYPAGPKLGVTVRLCGIGRDNAVFRSYMRAVANAVNWFIDSLGGQVYCFIQVHGPVEEGDDLLAAKELERQIQHKEGFAIVEGPALPEELMAHYAQMDVFLATRMHSAVFAVATGVPAVVIEYQAAKARGVFGQMGLGEWVITLKELAEAPERLQQLCARLWQQRQEIAAKLPELVEAQRRDALRNLELMAQFWPHGTEKEKK